LQFHERGQDFTGAHDETFSVAMRALIGKLQTSWFRKSNSAVRSLLDSAQKNKRLRRSDFNYRHEWIRDKTSRLNLTFKFNKPAEFVVVGHNKAPSVVAMRVNNPDCAAFNIQS
jgi:hypothetical protein